MDCVEKHPLLKQTLALLPVTLVFATAVGALLGQAFVCAYWPEGSGEILPTVCFYGGMLVTALLCVNRVHRDVDIHTRAAKWRLVLLSAFFTATFAALLAVGGMSLGLFKSLIVSAILLVQGSLVALLVIGNLAGPFSNAKAIIVLPLAVLVASLLIGTHLFALHRPYWLASLAVAAIGTLGLIAMRVKPDKTDRVPRTMIELDAPQAWDDAEGYCGAARYISPVAIALATIVICTWTRGEYEDLIPLEDPLYTACTAVGLILGTLLAMALVIVQEKTPYFLMANISRILTGSFIVGSGLAIGWFPGQSTTALAVAGIAVGATTVHVWGGLASALWFVRLRIDRPERAAGAQLIVLAGCVIAAVLLSTLIYTKGWEIILASVSLIVVGILLLANHEPDEIELYEPAWEKDGEQPNAR